MEYFDVVDEHGTPTGETVSRECAHREGILHRTAHVWVIRERERGTEVLLQLRSPQKDSFPNMYDTSSAGHVPAGDEPGASALRELGEELGIAAAPQDLSFVGTFHIQYEEEFHGQAFRDNEVAYVYVYDKPVDEAALVLQASEVSGVRWFEVGEVWQELIAGSSRFCVPIGGLRLLMDGGGRTCNRREE